MLAPEGYADLSRRFEEFAALCSSFCHQVMKEIPEFATMDPADNTSMNLKISRTVFGKWSIDILSLLYTSRGAGFQEMRKALGEISSRVLSTKLEAMEQLGLVQRAVFSTKPPRVQYSLTDKGFRIAKLGEPIFIYLRMTENLIVPMVTATPIRTRNRKGR